MTHPRCSLHPNIEVIQAKHERGLIFFLFKKLTWNTLWIPKTLGDSINRLPFPQKMVLIKGQQNLGDKFRHFFGFRSLC